ncbi:hypothetical protein [Bacillus sp. 2205SS5-2]|uniref:hypothetical protein n=1 Tax=Bacillus sp. 2205SS5-2 TaxID=3109031 RepID=UPI0030062660
MKKCLLSLLAVVLVVSTIAPTFGFAAEDVTDEVVVEGEEFQVSEGNDSNEISDDQELEILFSDMDALMAQTNALVIKETPSSKPTGEQRVGGTKAVKAAVKGVLNNKSRMFNLVEDVAGKRNRASIEKRFNKYK